MVQVKKPELQRGQPTELRLRKVENVLGGAVCIIAETDSVVISVIGPRLQAGQCQDRILAAFGNGPGTLTGEEWKTAADFTKWRREIAAELFQRVSEMSCTYDDAENVIARKSSPEGSPSWDAANLIVSTWGRKIEALDVAHHLMLNADELLWRLFQRRQDASARALQRGRI